MKENDIKLSSYVKAIARSGLSIYDPIEIGDPELWIPTLQLEQLLDKGLSGISLSGLPLRTRSKFVKQLICKLLGYPIPISFKKTRPRFPGQSFDTYVQKSNNLQVWNEQIVPTRRYVLIRVSNDNIVLKVKVVSGYTLAIYDKTGTLTQKYQARCIPTNEKSELVTPEDTDLIKPYANPAIDLATVSSPVNFPKPGQLLPIAVVFNRLLDLIGARFKDTGHDQERTRGATLHKLVCNKLGYISYQDDGRFPDIKHQLLEVKLQSSPTIDLGLVCPDSTSPLDIPKINSKQIRHCDIRYAIFYAHVDRSYDSL